MPGFTTIMLSFALLFSISVLARPIPNESTSVERLQKEFVSVLNSLEGHISASTILSSSRIAEAKVFIDSNKVLFGSTSAIMEASFNLVKTYDSIIGPMWVKGSPIEVFKRSTEPDSSIHWVVCTVMQNIIDKTYTVENIVANEKLFTDFKFGSSAFFPGSVDSPKDPQKVHTVKISASFPKTFGRNSMFWTIPARKPTGAYLAPGTIVTVTVPQSLVGKGYQIRVGGHSWDMFRRNSMYRPDRVSILFPINATEIRVANPLGGGIYIEVPFESDGGIVDIQIQNAVPSPYYSAKSFHQTNLEEWQNIQRKHKAPWADFQTEKFMMHVPTDWIYQMENPGPVLAEWDKAMDGTNELMGYDLRRGKETLFAQVDLDLPYGFHATGYPALNAWYDPNQDYGGTHDHYLLTGPRHANYVELHEMGHGYLFPKLETDIESTVNLLHVAALNNKLGVSLDEAFNLSAPGGNAYRTVDHAAIAWMMLPNFKNKKPMTGTEKMYQHKGHANYTEIARLFGWDVLHNYWREYMIDDEKGMVPKAIDGTSKDTILFRLSKAVGADITPLFQFWGVYADDPSALEKKIETKKIMPSMKIYRTLKKYQSLIPADKKAFQAFATQWWGGEEELARSKYLAIWDAYNEIYAAMVYSNVQDIIEHYFPDGPPEVVGANDTEAPRPNPMRFSLNPTANGEQSISMMASAGSDSTWVEYYFTNTSGNGHNSEWQSSRLYVDTGLSANTKYTYTVKARDYSPAKNMTAPSRTVSATTYIKDTSRPEPAIMSMKQSPIANSPSTIYMEANIATDVSGVEYNFVCTTEGGHNSGWQDDPAYTDIGLKPNTSYSYTVIARDKSPQRNSTRVSSELSATTLEAVAEPYLVMSKPVYAVGEEIVVHYVDPSLKKWAWIGIFSPPSDVSHSPGDGIQYQYISENPNGEEISGTITFTGMVKGTYQARIHYGEGYQIFARIKFSIE